MKVYAHAPLAPYTSFECGGDAGQLLICESYAEAREALQNHPAEQPLWLLGYGCNVLISDHGLPGTSLLFRNGAIELAGEVVIADAGVWWDDLVSLAISKQLWGLELMSGIPGGVGAAIVGNIAAYGQAVADSLAWVEVYDTKNREIRQVEPNELGFSYRQSNLQTDNKHLAILRAAFRLSAQPTHELKYQTALDIAQEKGYDAASLTGRRDSVLGARDVAGSLWDYRDSSHTNKTAGSFFRNPIVTAEQAEKIIAFDETGKSAELIKKMNATHGGESLRVSAAHVLLAAGFQRGQMWGDVRLHPQHVLKLENAGSASAQQIYDVAHEIMDTVHAKLGITLTPEVRFLGEFDS